MLWWTVPLILLLGVHPAALAFFNPVKVATHEYVAIVKDIKAAGSWRERAGRLFRGPGRQPASVSREQPAEETAVA